MPHLEDDRLVQLGLHGTAGADRPTVEHLDTCVDCRTGVEEIARTVRMTTEMTAASDRSGGLDTPPAGLWERIEAQTGDLSTRDAPGRPPTAARWIAAAAVVGCLLGAGATAIVMTARSADPPDTPGIAAETVASASLSVPVGTGSATGTATLVNEDGRWTLVVDTRGLDAGGGYFEVWLLDAAGRMYALGALPEGSTARLAVPDGISVSQFNIVDISAQEFNGDPSHSRDSVLRGTLRT